MNNKNKKFLTQQKLIESLENENKALKRQIQELTNEKEKQENKYTIKCEELNRSLLSMEKYKEEYAKSLDELNCLKKQCHKLIQKISELKTDYTKEMKKTISSINKGIK